MAAREVNSKKETPVMALSRASAGSQPGAPPAICVPTVTDCFKWGLDLTAITQWNMRLWLSSNALGRVRVFHQLIIEIITNYINWDKSLQASSNNSKKTTLLWFVCFVLMTLCMSKVYLHHICPHQLSKKLLLYT